MAIPPLVQVVGVGEQGAEFQFLPVGVAAFYCIPVLMFYQVLEFTSAVFCRLFHQPDVRRLKQLSPEVEKLGGVDKVQVVGDLLVGAAVLDNPVGGLPEALLSSNESSLSVPINVSDDATCLRRCSRACRRSRSRRNETSSGRRSHRGLSVADGRFFQVQI